MTGPINSAMKELQKQTATTWTTFARTGNPNHKGLPTWPAYKKENKAVMLFDAPSRVEVERGAELRKLVKKDG